MLRLFYFSFVLQGFAVLLAQLTPVDTSVVIKVSGAICVCPF